MTLAALANLVVFALAAAWLFQRRRQGTPLSTTVLLAVLLGVVLGAAAQGIYGLGSPAITGAMPWVGVVGSSYIRLLQMVIAPLVLVSILAAVTKLNDTRSLGKISAGVLGLLLATTAVSAMIGIGMTQLFGLRADGLVQGARELERGTYMAGRVAEAQALNVPTLLQNFVPTNIFADLAGTRSTSVIGVVVFAVLLGLAALALRKDNPEVGERIMKGIESLQLLVLRLVRMVIRLTPYGVLALMTRVVATSNVNDVISLGTFVVASYTGMAIILLMHAGILAATGLSPVRFYQKIWPLLTFAFTSRSSGAAIPLSIDTQVTRPGRRPGDRQLLGQLRRHHRPERLCRAVPGDAGDDDRAQCRHRPDIDLLPRVARRRGHARLIRHRRGRRRRHLRRSGRALHAEPAGGPRRPAHLGGAAHRHGPHRGERERVGHRWYGDQPAARPDRHGGVRRRRRRCPGGGGRRRARRRRHRRGRPSGPGGLRRGPIRRPLVGSYGSTRVNVAPLVVTVGNRGRARRSGTSPARCRATSRPTPPGTCRSASVRADRRSRCRR